MSGALWHFFWDSNDWGGAPPAPSPSPAPATEDSGSGGGKKRNDDLGERAPADFWDVREGYLKFLTPPAPPPPKIFPAPKSTDELPASTVRSFDFNLLPRFLRERKVAVEQLKASSTPAQIRARAARLNELNQAIQRTRDLQAQLQAQLEKEERRQANLKTLKKLRYKLNLLQTAKQLVSLFSRLK